jgi:Glycosyl transferase family 2
MSTYDIPEYVTTVIREVTETQLNLIKTSSFSTTNLFYPILISVVKNEITRLRDFLRHYRSCGIERFVFIDNGSTDGSVEFLCAQPDVDIYVCVASFNWMRKQGWINSIIGKYGYDRWYVCVDADEQMVYDGFDQYSIADLAWHLEREGVLRARGFLIDMYSDVPLTESVHEPGQRLVDAFPWFDRDTYIETRFEKIMSVKGGPRPRAFGRADEPKFSPEMTKYPLFKLRSGEYMAHPHHIWPYEGNFDSSRIIGILHFKFLPDFIGQIKEAVEVGNYWDNSYEYRCYLRALQAVPDLSLHCDISQRFESADQLVSLGLIARVGWSDRMLPPADPGVVAVGNNRAGMEDRWLGWVGHRGAELRPGGIVEILEGAGPSGIVSPLVEVPEGGLYRLIVTLAREPSADAKLRVRVTDPYEERMGPETEVGLGSAEFEFFVPHRVRALKIYILDHSAIAGLSFALANVYLERIGSEFYFWQQRRALLQPCIASMASIPSRCAMMRDAVESLLIQCDLVRVFLNE